jgi:sulfate transport system ATP-binding protein
MTVSLAIENASRRFSDHAALNGVSLSVAAGELVALLGPSGSGKTTLLRLIAGLDQPDGGSIRFDGVDAATLSLRERRIGMVFQSYALFRHMSVADNIAFGLRARPRGQRPSEADIARRVGELLDLVQLPGLQARFPSQLSGGQRQRVALARALAIEPGMLLLDEPFGALDARVRKDLRSWLRELHAQTGHTTLFVTHDQDEALELADRVAILNNGLLEQVGTADEVYDSPASAFVCGFLGEANRIPVVLVHGQALFGERPVFQTSMAQAAALKNDEILPGRKADLFVRPHQFRIDMPGVTPLSGKVSSIRRNGAIRRMEVAIEGLPRRLDVEVPGTAAFAIGDRVGLRVMQGYLFTVT